MEKCQYYETLKEINKTENVCGELNLIKSVKSIFIFKKVFSYLLELRKLTLTIYNKKIQNKLGIDLEYIKKISGRYQTRKKDGYGKLYRLKENISLLIYKGEYKNGKWNGKGKEYNEQGEKIFEGEYLNGKNLKEF